MSGNPYTQFVKENYAVIKAKNPDTNSKDILKLLASEWNATKPPKADKPKVKKPTAPKEPKAAKLKRTTNAKLRLNEDNVEDSIANIEDEIQSRPPPTALAQKTVKPSPKTTRTKRKIATFETAEAA